MKIAIEARALARPASGIRTYVQQLVAALPKVAPEHAYIVLDKGPRHEALWPLWLNRSVPRWTQAVKPDVVHFTKAATPWQKQYPTVVTIYDVIPILFRESQKLLPRMFWPATLRHAAKSADHIITISEASKRDIVEYLQVAVEKVTVTPLAVSSSPSPNLGEGRVRYKNEGQTPYILFLSTLEPRKNVPALVRAFGKIAAQIPHQLLIAGRSYKGLAELEREVGRLHLEERVKILGAVPGEQLAALYADADLFVMPSIYEGWGFPVQEAMAAGVPVIVSNGGSLPEVVGDAGEVVSFTVDAIPARTHDEAFEANLAERILAVLTDPGKQSRMRAAGLLQVQRFSWEDVARKTIAVYDSLE